MAADWIIFRGSQKSDRNHPYIDVKSRGLFFYVFHRFILLRFEFDPILSKDNFLKHRIHSSYHSSMEHLNLELCSSQSLRAIARNLIEACKYNDSFWINWLNPLPDQWESGFFTFRELDWISGKLQQLHETELAAWRRNRPTLEEDNIHLLGTVYMKTYFLEIAGAALVEVEKRQLELVAYSSRERIVLLLKGIVLGKLLDEWCQYIGVTRHWVPIQKWLKETYPSLDYERYIDRSFS